MAGMNEWIETYTAPLRAERDALRRAVDRLIGFVGCRECPAHHEDCRTRGEGRCKEYVTAWAVQP